MKENKYGKAVLGANVRVGIIEQVQKLSVKEFDNVSQAVDALLFEALTARGIDITITKYDQPEERSGQEGTSIA